jgi:acetolactate synthase-1/2/3 large subunit
MTIDAGRLTVAQLKREGIDHLFSLNGGHVALIYDACLDLGIRIVDVRHEDAAVHMAHAWSRLTRRTGVACVTAGPGVTNTVTAMAAAFVNASPLVLVGGKAPVRQFDLGALQDVDQIGVMRPVTKAAFTIFEGARAPEYMNAAIRLAHTAPHGPVYVEIPTDVMRETVEGEIAAHTLPPSRIVARPAPDPDQIDQAIRHIERAERPLILAGSGVVWSDGQAALRRLAERLQAPVLTTSLARGLLPRDHPLNLGAARSYLLGNADLILVAGTRFNYVLGYGRPPRIPAQATVIQIDLSPGELNRNRVTDLAIHADVGAALETLASRVSATAPARSWLTEARTRQTRARKALRRDAATDAQPIHPLRLCREVVTAVPPETIFVLDGGDILSFGRLAVETDQPGRFLDPGPYGCLGVGLPFANAAKLARPDAPVVCVSGDGALGINLMEFDTAVRHRLPVVVVVSNNAAWGIEWNSQRLDFGADRTTGTALRDCRFDVIAQALGGHGERVTDPAALGPAVRRALDAGIPALVDVVTDATAASPDLRRGLARVPDRQPLDAYGSEPGRPAP